MNTTKIRGIQSIRANAPDPKAVVAALQQDWAEFKANHIDRLDKLETMFARTEFMGGGAPATSGPTSAAVKEHKQAFLGFIRKGVDNSLRELEVKAAMTTQSDPDGGYLVTEEIDKEIEKYERDSSAIRRVARIKPITASAYKKIVNAGGSGSGWTGEVNARPETATPDLKQIVINAMELYANPAVSQTLLDDADFSVEDFLSEEIGDEFVDQEGEAFVTGNGVGRPRGILAYPTSSDPDSSREFGTLQYVASGSASTFADPDILKTLKRSLRARYRRGAVWIMNSTTAEYISKFKDGDGRYIWQEGLSQGDPDTLLGFPVEEDEFMPDIAANSFPIAFGNFQRGYVVADRMGVRLLRDPYTNKPYVHFYATKRVGGGCINHQAIKLLKIAAN
jgi:HK97 family phage major capsid protein